MMLVAPMLQKGADVKLPTAANTTDKPDTQGQTVVAIAADKRVFRERPPRCARLNHVESGRDARSGEAER